MSDNCCCGHSHGHEHNHEHNHGHSEKGLDFSIVSIAFGAVLVLLSLLPAFNDTIKIVFQLSATVICGFSVFLSGIKSLKSKRIDETVLLIIAVVAALLLKEFFEAAVVCVLFGLGELMEEFASGRSRKSIEALYGIVSDTANAVLPDGSFKKIDADDVEVGDIIAILPHEIIPVDCVVEKGEGAVDVSALTGESLPVSIGIGSLLSGGTVNGSTTLIAKATSEKHGSAASRIVEMVENAISEKGEAQRAVSVFAKYYTPAIIVAAVIIAVVPSLVTGEWSEWIHRSLILLVAACPCAIVISAPLAFFSSMGACAKIGIIIKGSRFIEALSSADTAVFDKTGTLTTGDLSVERVYACEGFNENEVLELAALCEFYSTHPIAKAIVAKAGLEMDEEISDFSEISGGGTKAFINGKNVACGGKRFMSQMNIDTSSFPKLPVYVAVNSELAGAISVEGAIREDSAECIKALKKLGIKNIVMLTGDGREQAKKIAEKCGISDFKAELLPGGKLEELRKIKDNAKGVIYAGDGINDAPVLAAADVGIAMGLGTRAAGEAADVILTNSEISKLSSAVRHSKKTMFILKVNIIFAIIVKIAVIALGIAGVAPMWSAIVADVGTMLVCVANAARLLTLNK